MAALGVVDGDLDVRIEVGSGTATLRRLDCVPTPAAGFDVDTAGARILEPPAPAYGQLRLGTTLASFMDHIPGLGLVLRLALQGLGVDVVGLDVLAGAEVASAHRPGVTVTYPAGAGLPPGTSVSGNASMLRVSGLGVRLSAGSGGAIATVLGGVLTPTLDAVLGQVVGPVLNAAVDPLLTATLNPVLGALGISLANTDLEVLSRPECGAVRLAG
jgi:hypothetical protein